MSIEIPFKRLSDADELLPFNGFLFMGSQERLRYEKQKGDTVAMYFDLMQIV